MEYACLFILFYRALKNTSNLPSPKIALWAFILTFFYAISDEYHQTFIPGRTGTLRDVMIDTGGEILAWIGIWKYLPKAPAKLKSLAKKLEMI